MALLGEKLHRKRETIFCCSCSRHWRHEVPALTYLLTYSMVQSSFWAVNWFAASQEIPRISLNLNVHYHTHNRPPTFSILDQSNTVHKPTSHLLELYHNIIHSSTLRSPQCSFHSGFPTKTLYTPLSSPIRATWHAHLILLDFITRTILVEKYISFSSSLMQSPPVPRYLVPPRSKYSPQHLVLKHPQLHFLTQCQRPSITPIQNNNKIIVPYILIFKFLDSSLEDKSLCTE